MRYPELAVTFAIAECVVCITGSYIIDTALRLGIHGILKQSNKQLTFKAQHKIPAKYRWDYIPPCGGSGGACVGSGGVCVGSGGACGGSGGGVCGGGGCSGRSSGSGNLGRGTSKDEDGQSKDESHHLSGMRTLSIALKQFNITNCLYIVHSKKM